MKLVGLGGGIGAGKTSVSQRLRALGAVIVDADVIARQVVEPGSPALDEIRARFGDDVIAPDGTLLRQALAAKVFTDKDALAALNAITHPRIGAEIARQIAAEAGTDRVVVLDAALLFDTPRAQMVGKMLVDVDTDLAVERLVRHRGFDEADARRRVAAQMTREARRARADLVIDNSGSPADLDREVAHAWAWIGSLPDSPPEPPAPPPPDADPTQSTAAGGPDGRPAGLSHPPA